MSGSKKSSSTQTVRLSPELRDSSLTANAGAQSLYGQGTEGIYQGSLLAPQDQLIQDAQNAQLGLVEQGGDIYNTIQQQQDAFRGLLNAGNINDPLVQRQIEQLGQLVGDQFNRNIMPGINQGATAAGQYGSSRQGVAQGIAAGDAANAISRGATAALLGGQQLALGAQGMAPQSIGLGFLPAFTQQDIGNQRTQLSQQQLMDQVQQFNAGRNAELQNLSEFTNLLGANPLMQESTSTTKSKSSGSLGQTLAGLATTAAGIYTGNPAAFAGLGSMFGGGAPMMSSVLQPQYTQSSFGMGNGWSTGQWGA